MKEGGQSTHKQGERVKIPDLLNKVGKRSHDSGSDSSLGPLHVTLTKLYIALY